MRDLMHDDEGCDRRKHTYVMMHHGNEAGNKEENNGSRDLMHDNDNNENPLPL